jgi:hypothetical protein
VIGRADVHESFELDRYPQIPERFKELWKRDLRYDTESASYLWHLVEAVTRDWQKAALNNSGHSRPKEPPDSQAKSELLTRFWWAIVWGDGGRFARQLLQIQRRPYLMWLGERDEYKPRNLIRFLYVDLVREQPPGRVVTYPMLEAAARYWYQEHSIFQSGKPPQKLSLPKSWHRLLRSIGLEDLPGTPERGRPRKRARKQKSTRGRSL